MQHYVAAAAVAASFRLKALLCYGGWQLLLAISNSRAPQALLHHLDCLLFLVIVLCTQYVILLLLQKPILASSSPA